MGFSATTASFETLAKLDAKCRATTGSSNTWKVGRVSYFYEIGEENANQDIRGKVFKLHPDGTCSEFDYFHINRDGTVNNFPGVPKKWWA